jgi:thiol-disulfide isomerase/thioredoxin
MFKTLLLLLVSTMMIPALEFPLSGTTADGQLIQINPVADKKPVLLVFWASWCNTCIREIPAVTHLFNASADKITVISCNIDPDVKAVQEAVTKHHISYPVIADKDLAIGDKFSVETTPTLVLIDAQGKIIGQNHSLHQLKKPLAQLGIETP